MWLLDELAERRIADAIARGELDDLRGRGRPLSLDDDSAVPPELRVAYRVLKNAGYVPPELELRREISTLARLLVDIGDSAGAVVASRRLSVLRAKLAVARGAESPPALDDRYEMELLQKLERDQDRA